MPGESQLNLRRCYQRHDEDVSSFCTHLETLVAKLPQKDLQKATREEEAGVRKQNEALLLNQIQKGTAKEFIVDQLVRLHETTIRMVQGKD